MHAKDEHHMTIKIKRISTGKKRKFQVRMLKMNTI
jgi:hypothetical protein